MLQQLTRTFNGIWFSKKNLVKITEAATVKKSVPENLANFTGKHLCCGFFLIKWQAFWPAALLKRDSNTGFFL